ncbi:MAG: ABC transporter permease [Anaerolineae bacterium]|nr:ABC transporter permease [Anaerolineae bacterium]
MTTGTTPLRGGGDERLAQAGFVRGMFRRVEIGALIGAVIVWLFFALITPSNWISVVGFSRILDPASTLGIMAIAVALLMIGGEFDLSTGVMVGTTGLVAGLLSTRMGWNLWAAMFAALVFALIVGYLNGFMVIKTGLPSFIVTLATFFILRGANVGVTRLVTDQVYVGGIDKVAGFDAARAFFNTPVQFLGAQWQSSIVWWILLTILASWVLLRTKQGSWIFAVGGDAEAARKVGVPSARVKIGLFMTTAVAAWLVGMMYVVRLRSAVASQGIGQEFVFIIAATIGGTLLTGGYGSAVGAAIGALIFGMAQVGIVFAGWDTDWFYSFLGVMLLVAVLVNNYTRRRATEMSVASAKVRTEGN